MEFYDLPNDCIEQIVLSIIKKDISWKSLFCSLQVNKDIRAVTLSILHSPYCKWNDIMIDNGKVSLDRLRVTSIFSSLRDRLFRFVEGKSKFIYKNIIYQLNHHTNVHSLLILFDNNNCTIRWTSCQSAMRNSRTQTRYLEAYGASICHNRPHKHPRDWYHSFIKTSVDDIRNGLKLLCKLKARVIPAEMVTEVHDLLHTLQQLHTSIPRNNIAYWAAKHKRWNAEVDNSTLLESLVNQVHDVS